MASHNPIPEASLEVDRADRALKAVKPRGAEDKYILEAEFPEWNYNSLQKKMSFLVKLYACAGEVRHFIGYAYGLPKKQQHCVVGKSLFYLREL